MKKDSFFSERIKPVIIMAVITIVCITLVSGIHLSTVELVIANEGLVLKKAVLYAGGIDIPDSNLGINDLYDERVSEKQDIFIIRGEDGSPLSYAFIAAGPGLWGEIEAVVAFNTDLETFAGVDFIKQNETPGLGARITEEWFKQQLRGKNPPLSLASEGESEGPDQIDAITGATRTSNYILQLFNDAGIKAAELEKEDL